MTVGLSAYDEDVPGADPDPVLAARFAGLRAQRPAVDLGRVRDVVLLVGSSRGGSSMLTEILRRTPGVLSLPAEMNPYVEIARLSSGRSEMVAAELARAIGSPACADDVDRADLVAQVRWRLAAQWPAEDPSAQEVAAAVDRALDGGAHDDLTEPVLRELGAAHPALDPDAYDGAVRPPRRFRQARPVVEMSPYVRLRPWRLAADEQLTSSPLVVGTPRNSYRIDWIRGLFPNARLRLLHLTRNPTSAINGLVDGWRHWAFASAWVPEPLRFPGYVDPSHPRSHWWCYDVPPGWQSLDGAPLAAVAAVQWTSAHRAVLAAARALPAAHVLRVRHEDLLGDPRTAHDVAHRLAAFLGIDPDALARQVSAGVPPVMATAPPGPRRWAFAGNDLAAGLGEPHVWDTAAALGYEAREALWI